MSILQNQENKELPKPNKKSKIPYFFVIFFAVFISVDLLYIYLSKTTWRGVVSEDSYAKGIDYNQIIALTKKQQDLGWDVTISYQNTLAMQGRLKVEVLDKVGKYLSDAQVIVKLKRPLQEGMDFEKKLNFISSGLYQVDLIFPVKGQWQFEIIIKSNEELLQKVKKYVVQ
ncbi:MAG: hypothetical protein RL769_411 [Pseudomonadota bacterium]|jgi:nitrogen fixation protein FixH